MNQIYNLQQTIYEEEQEILLLKKEVLYKEGVLKSHKQALERLLSPPKYAPYSKEKTYPQATQEELEVFEDPISKRERITPDNFRDLGIKVGDSVDIVVSGDPDITKGIYTINDVHIDSLDEFIHLEGEKDWYFYNYDNFGQDELYLIRKESKMDKQEFENLRDNLYNHHFKFIDNFCTSSPIYLVQKKVVDWGYEEESAEHHQLYNSCCESSYESVQEFVDDYDDEEWEEEFGDLWIDKEHFKLHNTKLYWLQDTLNDKYPHGGWQYLHGNSRWETVEIFLTKESADKYIDSRGIRGNNCRLYVDSLYKSHEFKELLENIANGNIVWNTEES